MIPSSSQADVQPAPPTQNPTASSEPSLSPSPSQRLLKVLSARSVHIEPRALSRGRYRALAYIYHTPDASVGSFSSEAGLGLIRRSGVGGGAGSSRYSDVGTVTTEGGEWEWYDAHSDISASGSRSVSANGLSEMAGLRIVSRQVSSVGLRNGNGLAEDNGSGSDDRVYDVVHGDFIDNDSSHNSDECKEKFISTSTRFTTSLFLTSATTGFNVEEVFHDTIAIKPPTKVWREP
ncbi:hypothetical protein BJ165DRAFT_1532621 [Panaeolus papilionaceus]|nr:hypothetical protein BJ165DRAFT_1532621 [Panaeolus papilionaceus]